MKYFTPDLLARGQIEDDRVLHEVEASWDERCEKYSAYLAAVKPRFPSGLRHIAEHYYLHDASVRGMGQRDGVFVIVLQLDTPPHLLLTFSYQLLASPVVIRDAVPEAARLRGEPLWLYDEIEEVAGEQPAWLQSILFSNGWEVRLRFQDVSSDEAQALLPVLGAHGTTITGTASSSSFG